MSFFPKAPDFVDRVRDSFDRQPVMKTCGIELVSVEPGEIAFTLQSAPGLTQQHGFIHAGILATALDSACGFAAFSLMPVDAGVLTIEFKINLLAPARGDVFDIRGHVVKPGRTITVCEATATARDTGSLVSTMTATVMTIVDRPGISG